MTTPTEVVRNLYAKLTAGDAPGALALMTDDVEWIPMMHYRVEGRGPQHVLDGMLKPAMAEWVSFTLTPSEFIEAGNCVVSLGTFSSAHRVTGKVAKVRYAHAWEVADGKVSRFRQYIDTAAIEAARHA